MLSFKSLQTFFCIKQRPGSFSDLIQVLPESEHNHKHFHTAGVSTSRDFTATSDILVEKKQPGTLFLNIELIRSESTFLQLKHIN